MDGASRKLEHPSGMTVELLESMSTDLDIVNAARVSYGKQSDWEYWRYNPFAREFQNRASLRFHEHTFSSSDSHYNWQRCLSVRDAGILNYMMREEHGTPFEMVQFKFRVHAPIGVVWEWVRHRISSFNVMSTRYVEMPKEFYIPLEAQVRRQVGKAGAYTFQPMTAQEAQEILDIYITSMFKSYESYEKLLEKGLAKEVARNVLPMGLFTEFIWSVNLRSLFNFLHLRTAPAALHEIQIPARMVEELASQVVPEAFNAWRRNGKKAP